MTENKQFEKFRKIPVVIEAYQTDVEMEIETLEGIMKADKGDWIIKGVKGELYPCKPDVFEMTYEKVARMTEKRLVTITVEDDFGRTHTIVKTRLSPPMLMDKILELEEVE